MPRIPLPTLRRWVKAVEPATPLTDPDDAKYVDFDAGGLRASDGSALQQLADALLLADPDSATALLFSGYPGTGKTTELHRLQRALADGGEPDATVVMIDANQYFDTVVKVLSEARRCPVIVAAADDRPARWRRGLEVARLA